MIRRRFLLHKSENTFDVFTYNYTTTDGQMLEGLEEVFGVTDHKYEDGIGTFTTKVSMCVYFTGCITLESIIIPEGIRVIMNAFEGCTNLTSVVIPNSVTSIGDYAFYNCSGLTEIICYATTAPRLLSTTFSSISSSGVLKVPTGSDYSSWLEQLPSDWIIEYI